MQKGMEVRSVKCYSMGDKDCTGMLVVCLLVTTFPSIHSCSRKVQFDIPENFGMNDLLIMKEKRK